MIGALAHRQIVMAAPTGEAGGGMGAMAGSILEGLARHAPDCRVSLLDPRGPGPAWRSPIQLLRAAAAVAMLPHNGGGSPILHLHVSERASFWRKGVLLRLGRARGYRTLLHHHGAEFISSYPRLTPPMRAWVRHTVKLADRNVVLGNPYRDFFINTLKVPAERVTVLPNAVADWGFRPRPPTASGTTRFLLLGNLSDRKGVGVFLGALAVLRRDGLAVTATLAGGGEVARFRHMAETLGIAEAVRFTGWVARDDALARVRAADALVLPSRDEGLPLAILEALSMGTPVIATPVGAIPEVLTADQDALLVAPGDAAALASAMRRLATDPALRARLSNRGRMVFETRFGLPAYLDRLLSLYADLAAEG